MGSLEITGGSPGNPKNPKGLPGGSEVATKRILSGTNFASKVFEKLSNTSKDIQKAFKLIFKVLQGPSRGFKGI
jgi:hypothetical protein